MSDRPTIPARSKAVPTPAPDEAAGSTPLQPVPVPAKTTRVPTQPKPKPSRERVGYVQLSVRLTGDEFERFQLIREYEGNVPVVDVVRALINEGASLRGLDLA